MRKLKVIGLAFAAVFAFTAVAVGSAQASLWEWLESGTAIPSTSPATVNQSGTLELSDMGAKVTLKCTGKGAGKVWEMFDETTSATAESCTVVEGFCPGALAHAVDLPWLTELVGELGTTPISDALLPDGKGNPGWDVECAGFIEDTCTASEAHTTEAENGSGGVTSTFATTAAEEALSSCSLSKTKTALVNGTLTGTLASGLALELS